MPIIQPGQNSVLDERRLQIRIQGEPADAFARQTLPGVILLQADGRAIGREGLIDESRVQAQGIHYRIMERSFECDLDAIPADIQKIAIVLAVRPEFGPGVTFTTLRDIRIVIYGSRSEPLLVFPLPSATRGETALILGECYRRHQQWKFRAFGQGFSGGLQALAAHFSLYLPAPAPQPGPEPTPNPGGGGGGAGSGAVFGGTGFCVSADGYFLTNHHVIDGAAQIYARAPRDHFPLRLVFSDPNNDLALLKTDSPVSATAAFRAGTAARLGENVVVIGYPLSGYLGSSAQVTTGNISSLIGIRDDTRILQFTAPVQSGNSGGPLLDSDGTIIGVVSSKLDAARIHELTGDIPQNVNFAVKSALAQCFLEAVGVEYATRNWQAARAPAEVAAEAQRWVVRIECRS